MKFENAKITNSVLRCITSFSCTLIILNCDRWSDEMIATRKFTGWRFAQTQKNSAFYQQLHIETAGIEPFTYHGSNIASRPIPSCSMLSVTGDGCGTNMFRCNDGKCIQLILVCDYRGDCDDNSDEMQSCRKYQHSPLAF